MVTVLPQNDQSTVYNLRVNEWQRSTDVNWKADLSGNLYWKKKVQGTTITFGLGEGNLIFSCTDPTDPYFR